MITLLQSELKRGARPIFIYIYIYLPSNNNSLGGGAGAGAELQRSSTWSPGDGNIPPRSPRLDMMICH